MLDFIEYEIKLLQNNNHLSLFILYQWFNADSFESWF